MKSQSILQGKKAQLGGQGTEVGQLYQFVLLIVLVGMIIGVGVITLDKFGAVVFYQRVDFNDTATIAEFNVTYALAYGNLTNVESVLNSSGGTISTSLYTLQEGNGSIRFVHNDSGVILKGAVVSVIYDFKDYATATRDATGSTSTEFSNISSNWIGLIVTVFVLSIILFLVIRSFRPGIER